MANLHYDYSAFVIFVVIMFSMILRKVIKGRTNGIFFHVVLLSVFATVADIVSEWHSMPSSIRFVADTFYFLISVFIPLLYAFYIYSSIGLLHYVRIKKSIWIASSIPMFVYLGILIVNFFNNCAFTVDMEGNYIRGPFQPVLIACSLLYILFGIFIIIRWRSIIPLSKQIALFSLFPIMSASLLTQQFHQGLELTMFGLSVSELIISFTVQRHDESFDRETGDKSFESAVDDFGKIFLTHQSIYTIFIKITNSTTLKHYLGNNHYHKLIKMLSNDFRTIEHKYHVFCENYYMFNTTYAIKVESTNEMLVTKLAEDLARMLKLPFLIDDITLNLDSRVCVARLPEDIPTLEDFMNFRMNFHTKLPETKDILKLWEFSNSKEFMIKNEMNAILKRAIAEKCFQVYYQPIYSAKKHKFISAEALIRLNDKKYGFIPPSIFIPAAEDNGAIHDIGDFVIDSVCRFIASDKFKKSGLEYIELNLSVTQCVETDLVEKLEEKVAQYGISANQINLEITETADENKPEILDSNIKTLFNRGYHFSLDDYGTGYSNVKRLTELPLEIVKLDKSFVDEMDNPQMWVVIENTVNMFKQMDKIILVEGVENQKTLDTFIQLGCDYIQGYYFSKPLPETEFIDFLKEHN